jgi:hypothetical protein
VLESLDSDFDVPPGFSECYHNLCRIINKEFGDGFLKNKSMWATANDDRVVGHVNCK